jgi:hypothetical protein
MVKLTELKVLFWAAEELSYTLAKVFGEHKILAAVLMLTNEEAQYLN